MSNLGLYQWMTAIAKKVGGPIPFLALVSATGATAYKISEVSVKHGVKIIKTRRTNKLTSTSNERLYLVSSPGKSNEGIEFVIGDQYRVLEADGGSVLIEKIGAENNPYFVSAELLGAISDY